MKKRKDSKLYGILGLGRFGSALARALADSGEEVLVVDREQAKITAAGEYTENAYVTGELSRENLEAIGVQNCDVVVVAIGERLDTSLLTTMNVLKLGVKRVIAKAQSEEHGALLELMGAEVVYPEHDMAVRLAGKLMAPHILEYISLSNEIDIMEIEITEKAANRSVIELNVRGNFGLNIIALKHDGVITTEIYPTTALALGDTITVIGTRQAVGRFEDYLSGK